MQRGGNAPAQTRALTVAACAWSDPPLEVWHQTRWHASRRRQRGSARPRACPLLPQETGRVAAVGNGGRLTVAQVRAQALRAMQHHGTPQCLVIVDYLQLWAKVAEELRGGLSVRERVELLGGALRELASRRHSGH